jgi:adenylate cyclase
MSLEIERKFLVKGEYKKYASVFYHISQGYLCKEPSRTVRVRIMNELAFITVKGVTSNNGLTRFEWEKEISVDEAELLLKLCEPFVIKKLRYEINFENHIFEVDEFMAENEGLIIAEIELEREDEVIKIPSWIGEEVTGNKKYYNSYLSINPYKYWDHKTTID